MLGEALDPRRPFVRVGAELENPALRDVALVGASYGLRDRTLGAVSLLGPLRMDYENAIHSVRAAALRALALRRGRSTSDKLRPRTRWEPARAYVR